MAEKTDRRPTPESSSNDSWGSALILLIGWWLWMPLLMALIVGGGRVLFGGFGVRQQAIWQGIDRNMLHLGSWSYLWLSIGLVVTAVIVASVYEGLRGAGKIAAVCGIAAAYCFVMFLGSALWMNNEDRGRYNGSATTFEVAPNSTPDTLRDLLKGAHASSKPGCTLEGNSDVASCILTTDASLADYDFEPRTSSFAAAQYQMEKAGATMSGVDLMTSSLHYLPGTASEPARWTGVLDGSGYQNPVEGVMEWDGRSNQTTSCKFNMTDYQFGRAFRGTKSNDLTNLVAEKFPNVTFKDTDVSGYCKMDPKTNELRPVIILSVTRQHFFGGRSVQEPAGVIELTGSSTGAPHMVYYSTVAPGQYPVPVYPQSVVTAQIDATAWAAGHGNHDRGNFGFERTNIESNALNPGEYILESKRDGHLYAVTPLTPRSKSQKIVAYAVERVDQVGSGLNGLSIIMSKDANPQSMSTLEGAMNAMISIADPTIKVNGGALKEILPYGNNQFRGIIDVSGLSVAYIEVPSDLKQGSQVSFVNVMTGANSTLTYDPTPGSSSSAPTGGTPPTTPVSGGSTGTLVCAPPESLTTSQALACAQYYLGLAQSKTGAQSSASPTTPAPSATHS